jgi:hypothetical protein
MLSLDAADSLVSAIPFERITNWTTDSLGLSAEDFSAVVSHLHKLEEEGVVDVLSISRHRISGSSQATAIKFVRVQGSD